MSASAVLGRIVRRPGGQHIQLIGQAFTHYPADVEVDLGDDAGKELEVLPYPLQVVAQHTDTGDRPHVGGAPDLPDESDLAEDVTAVQIADVLGAWAVVPQYLGAAGEQHVHAAARAPLFYHQLVVPEFVGLGDQDRLADLIVAHVPEQGTLFQECLLHGQGQDLVQPDQPDPRHDDGGDQQIGEDRKQHGGGGEGTELGDDGEVGKEQDSETQGQGEAGVAVQSPPL